MTAARPRTRLALLAGGLLVAAVGFWAAGRGASAPAVPDTAISPPAAGADPPAAETPAEPGESLATAVDRAAAHLAAARSRPGRAGEVADTLMRAAELYREGGNDHEALAAYAEVQALRGPDHWQAREAARRAADLDAAGTRPGADLERLRLAREMHRAAATLFARGRYLPAVAVCERALGHRRALLAEPHHDVADSLHLLGRLQAGRGELYGNAADTLAAAREAYRRTLGPDHPAVAGCLHDMGVLEDDRGAFVEARDLYTAALDVALTARGEFSPEYARTSARLARMHADWWVTGDQELRIGRAMHVRETVLGPQHPDYAESLQDLGVVAFNFLQLEKAKALFTRARAIREAALGADHPATAESLSWLGRVLLDEADLSSAHESHRRALAVAEGAHGPDHPAVARALDHFARVCHDENDFDRGDRMFARAIAIRERHGLAGHPSHAELYLGRAVNLDEWAFGVVYWEGRAVDIRPVHDAYEEAVRRFEGIPTAARLPAFAGTLLHQPTAYYIDDYRLRTRADARAMIARARGMMEAAGPVESHPYYGQYLFALNQVAASEGDYPTTAARIEQLIAYNHGRYGTAYPYKSVVGHWQRVGTELHRGPRPGPLPPHLVADCAELLRHDHLLTDQFYRGQSSGARMGLMRGQVETLSASFSLVMRHGAPLDLYQQVIGYRGQVAAAQAVDRMAHDRPDLAPFMARLRETRRDMTRAVYTPPRAGADHPAWLAEVRRLGDRKEDLESEVAYRARAAAPPARPPVTLGDIQAALPAGAVLVEYCGFVKLDSPPGGRGRLVRVPELAGFVVRKDRPPVFVPLGSRAAIDDAVASWRRAVGETQLGAPPAGLLARTAAVADLVWKPIAAHLGPADTLLIAADGPVCGVPFAVLPGRAVGTYLLEDYRIGYVPAGRSVAVPPPPAQGAGLLAVGDVAYGAPGTPAGRAAHPVLRAWPSLPFTRLEADEVGRLFAGSVVTEPLTRLAGRDATAAGFARAAAGKPRFVHYAGHGFFADPGTFPAATGRPGDRGAVFGGGQADHPALMRNRQLLSGLVLAAGDHPADQLLTAEQVAGLDLRGTELVVLSACETGLGGVAAGEGVMSLQRAFLTAGSRAVVASLWKVDDAATEALMEEFYKNLWQKRQTKLDALRNAQLAVLRRPELVADRVERLRGIDTTAARALPAARAGRTDPTLWAAFILIGDGR